MRLIDADKLKKAFSKRLWFVSRLKCDETALINIIDNAPTVEWKDIELMGYVNGEQITKIKQSKIEGEWLEDSGVIACSICHTIWLYRRTNYCPNCGAKMINPKTLIDKVGPVVEQIAETATNFFEDETISGLLEEGEE